MCNVNLHCVHIVMFQVVFHACYRRSKALQSLCLLLDTVMPSLNKNIILSLSGHMLQYFLKHNCFHFYQIKAYVTNFDHAII